MKMREIREHVTQINKIRDSLGDHTSTAGRIKRPEGMKLYIFEAKIARLRKLEKMAAKKLEQGLIKWASSQSRN